MIRQPRIEFTMTDEDRSGLDALAARSGLTPAGLVRFGVKRLLADAGVILGDAPVSEHGDLDAFIAELRSDPEFRSQADNLAAAFDALDLEADGNAHAAGLILVLAVVAKAIGPIETRLMLMRLLVNYRGPVQAAIPRAMLKGGHR
jgi:hypothetical protein